MNKKYFYQILKCLYKDVTIYDRHREYNLLAEALDVFCLLEQVMPTLLVLNSDTQKNRDERNIVGASKKDLVSALQRIKAFPDVNIETINKKRFPELYTFLIFLQRIWKRKNIDHEDRLLRFYDESSTTWNFEQPHVAESFINSYVRYHQDNLLERDVNKDSRPDYIDKYEAINDKLILDVKADLERELGNSNVLYTVLVKISVNRNVKKDSTSKLINKLCENEDIARILYCEVDICGTYSDLYVLFYIQYSQYLNEARFIAVLESLIKDELECDLPAQETFNITNVNNIFRSVYLTKFNERNFIVLSGDITEKNIEFVEKNFIQFLYFLIGIGNLSDSPLNPQHISIQQQLTSTLIKKDLSGKIHYIKANEMFGFKNLRSFKSPIEGQDIWPVVHLSAQAQEYIQKISVIYKEKFAVWKMPEDYSLAMKIEIFIFTVMEANFDAFYANYKISTRSITRETFNIENNLTRQLFQFANIIENRQRLDSFKNKTSNKFLSRTLKHFFKIYDLQMSDDVTRVLLDQFMLISLEDGYVRQRLDQMINKYKYKKNIFLNYTKESSALNQQGMQITNTEKLIHIKRHITRLKKVQSHMKMAIKGDVVVIGCRFYCESKTEFEYKTVSQIFSSMLQDNKKTPPISDISYYIGYWEYMGKGDNNYIGYAANVIVMFKSSVLNSGKDVFTLIKPMWIDACKKVANLKNLELEGKVVSFKISSAIDDLGFEQCVIEATKKKLIKTFIEHISTNMVYQDLIDIPTYIDLPKWLIKKTVPKS